MAGRPGGVDDAWRWPGRAPWLPISQPLLSAPRRAAIATRSNSMPERVRAMPWRCNLPRRQRCSVISRARRASISGSQPPFSATAPGSWSGPTTRYGALRDYPIACTFGVYPLRQYLITFPGRPQALGIAWNSRPKEHGAQRWFSLYPSRQLEPGDPLHWTGRDQTWNYQSDRRKRKL